MGIAKRFCCGRVEGLRVGRFDLAVNTSAVLYRLGSTLIDTGPPNRWPVVHEFLRERPMERVLLTHHHEDHSGNAARIQTETGTVVLAHPSALPHLANGWRLRPYQRIFWGRPARLAAKPVPSEIELEEGGRLLALHTPGHAEDQVCYLEPERGWLFTGDLYISNKPRYLREDEDLEQLLCSLRSLLAYDFSTIFCGHRGVVPHGWQAIRDKLDYLEALRDNVRRLHGEGRSVREITRQLLGKEDTTSMATLYNFTKGNLIRACIKGERRSTCTQS